LHHLIDEHRQTVVLNLENAYQVCLISWEFVEKPCIGGRFERLISRLILVVHFKLEYSDDTFHVYIFSVNVALQNNVQLLKTLKLDGAFVVDMDEYHHSTGNKCDIYLVNFLFLSFR